MGYDGGMIGYSLYTGLVGVENLSVIAVIDIAALLFTFSIMSNVLVLIEDGKKVSVIEIVQNAFKTPAFLAVILGILASVSGLMNGFMLSPAGVIWTTMKDMITAAMSPMILLVVGYEVQLNREIVGNMPENCNNKSCYAADICNCSYFVDTYSWKIRSIVRDSNHCIYVYSWFDGNTGIY